MLPPETALWNFVESVVRDVFRAYNFQEIRTPIFESTELFARGVGEETDIVSKEMYTWEDGGQRPLPSGAIDEFDAMSYRELVTAQAFLNSLRMSMTEGRVTLDPDQKATFNQALNEFNAAQDLWKKYHSREITDPAAVGASIAQLINNISKFLKHLLLPRESGRTQSLTLRPETTAGIVRAYIEHKLWDRGLNKLYCIGPSFAASVRRKGAIASSIRSMRK